MRVRWPLLLILATTVLGCAEAQLKGLRVETVASGLASPVYAASPKDDARLFIVEQRGTIRVLRNGSLLPAPFLDISGRVSSGGERGLLSVAFHPDYGSNGYFYVDYTDRGGNTVISRFSVSADADVADPGSEKLILNITQPFANHNGGHVLFGPDGMLYIGMGDGGSGGDPCGNAQDRSTLLGDLLRIDVDHGDPYAIPADNPFVGQQGLRGEIWAWGLRNPWRIAFDRQAGLLYIADVGQNAWEEINVVPSTSAGLNFGWNIMEGNHCYPRGACSPAGLVLPALEYSHSAGCSVTGGFVYRGSRIPELAGHYFYADYCSGWVRSFRYNNGRTVESREWDIGNVGRVLSFGEDSSGELYILSDSGKVFRLARVP